MAPRAYIDRVDTLNLREHNGAVRGLTRRYRVTGLQSLTYKALLDSLNIAGVPSVPEPNTAIPTNRLSELGLEMLVLVDRNVQIVDGDPSCCDVDCIYTHVLDGDNQEMRFRQPGSPGGGTIGSVPLLFGRLKCSVQQVQANSYRDWAAAQVAADPVFDPTPLPPKKLITSEFTYNKDELGYKGGLPTFQPGHVTVPVPQANYQMGGMINTLYPYNWAKYLIATVNETNWIGEPPETWLCAEVGYEAVHPSRYRFHFEFQHNPDKWQPRAVFIDKTTGFPPERSNPTDFPNAWKEIPFLRKRNFFAVFNANIDGWLDLG